MRTSFKFIFEKKILLTWMKAFIIFYFDSIKISRTLQHAVLCVLFSPLRFLCDLPYNTHICLFLTKPAHWKLQKWCIFRSRCQTRPYSKWLSVSEFVFWLFFFCQWCLFRGQDALSSGGFPPTATCCALLRQKSKSITGGLEVNT